MAANQNHPKKGSHTKVGPFTPEQLKELTGLLKGRRRDLGIVVTGSQTNLRPIDLLNLNLGDARKALKTGYLDRWEKKTGKWRKIKSTTDIIYCFKQILADKKDLPDDAPLFANVRTGEALTVPTLNNMIKEWADWLGFKDYNYGAHSLRKTFGYIHRTVFKTPLHILMDMFNHSSQKQTLDYLCLTSEEIDDAYDQFNGFCGLESD